MQSGNSESLLNKNLKTILILLIAFFIVSLVLFRNIFFQSSYLLKSFGELSVDPEIAFNNDRPTFLEFYAEWCEVCKEMAPKVSALKEEYEDNINFVFLNVDNPKWDKFIRKFNVNGIPQVNLLDRKNNLTSTFIGKQEKLVITNAMDQLVREEKSYEKNINAEFSPLKKIRTNEVTPRSHG